MILFSVLCFSQTPQFHLLIVIVTIECSSLPFFSSLFESRLKLQAHFSQQNMPILILTPKDEMQEISKLSNKIASIVHRQH